MATATTHSTTLYPTTIDGVTKAYLYQPKTDQESPRVYLVFKTAKKAEAAVKAYNTKTVGFYLRINLGKSNHKDSKWFPLLNFQLSIPKGESELKVVAWHAETIESKGEPIKNARQIINRLQLDLGKEKSLPKNIPIQEIKSSQLQSRLLAY